MTITAIELDGSRTADNQVIVPGQWRLAAVELVNWGTFHGHTRLTVARKGHLITGPSGSGKSSLLDAIATVLTPQSMVNYNAAAQDSSSRGDDRNLVSYVRGAWSKQADTHEDRAVSTYLRTGAVWSGVLLRFDTGDGDTVTLARLFHLRAGSVDKADLKDLAFADRGEASLTDFEHYVSAGIDARALKRAWPDAVVTTTGGHKPYFARIVRLLGIGSVNALQLLHRTQAAKNLGSLDRLFRDFMLDTPSTFDRAKAAVAQFGDLNEAHRLVVRARQQLELLRSMEPSIAGYEENLRAGDELRRLQGHVDGFDAQLLHRIAEKDLAQAQIDLSQAESAQRAATERYAVADEELQLARRRTSDVGGAAVDQAREKVADAKNVVGRTDAAWQRFCAMLSGVSIDRPAGEANFLALRDVAHHELAKETDSPPLRDHDDHESYSAARRRASTLEQEIGELEHRRSNIDGRLLQQRAQLSAELGVSEAALPFAGELIDIRPAHVSWTGAIERVLRPLSTALLVRREYLAPLRRTIDGRHLGVRLVFEEVPATWDPPRQVRSDRSLLHRIDVREGPFREWLSSRLSTQFDYECVDSPDDLEGVERGVTIAGQVKTHARRYEKNDASRVDDRSRWVLGGDNELKLADLRERLEGALRHRDEYGARLDAADHARSEAARRQEVLRSIVQIDWSELDRESAEARLERQETRLRSLTDENSTLTDALVYERAAQQASVDALRDRDVATAAAARVTHEKEAILKAMAEAVERMQELPEVTDDDARALDGRYRSIQRRIDRANIGSVQGKVMQALVTEERAAMNAVVRARSVFEAAASEFLGAFPDVADRLTSSIDDRAGYRSRRADIETRGLPDHESRFLQLLREKSRDAIGLLLSAIRDAPKEIRDRIDPVNDSLSRSEFDRGRTLRIRVKEQRSSEVSGFISDLRAIVDGSWSDNDLEVAEQRFAVLDRVMRRLGSSERADQLWQRRCLDTREHVTFQAQELDARGAIVNLHDSSAGLSGGQRQKLVIFCLAAALRYQLVDGDGEVPSYGSIILDEAFDKADSTYTRMALDIFREFGFHMILATPQKLLTTIEPYVGAVTAVSNESRQQSTIAQVVWNEASPRATESP